MQVLMIDELTVTIVNEIGCDVRLSKAQVWRWSTHTVTTRQGRYGLPEAGTLHL